MKKEQNRGAPMERLKGMEDADMNKIIAVLISLLEEQEGVEITYKLVKREAV